MIGDAAEKVERMTDQAQAGLPSSAEPGPQLARRPGFRSLAAGWEGAGTAVVLILVWLLIIVASAAYKSDFLSRQTLLSVTFTMAVAGVLTVGQSIVTISGGVLDLSIPTALILPAWVIVTLLGHGVALWLVVLAALLTGMAWEALNAAIIVFGKLNPVIVTLGTNFAGGAFLNIYIGNAQTPLSSGLSKWGRTYFLGLPHVFWPMLALIAVAGYLLPRTRLGRRTIAVGGNPEAARTRGISLRKTRFGVFMLAGALAGFAAVLFTAANQSFVSTDGQPYLFTAIAATLVAGVSLSGGSGNLWLTFLSVGLLSTIPTSLAFFGVPTLWQLVPPGAILIIAIALDGYRRLRAAR